MYLYVAATWLIANLVHPLMLFLVYGAEDFAMDILGFGLQFVIYSFLFSIPSLFLSFLVMYVIFKLPLSSAGRYISWVISAPVIVVINYWLVFNVIFNTRMGKEGLEFMLPAMIAVVLAILIRYASFFRAVADFNKQENERDLV